MIPNQATQRQNTAADPRASTWLSANAGSGKTRVLTNRVARLLLAEVEPQNILCLTYTKAAAAEMQNRLFETLGKWAMMDDDTLRTDLRKLGEDGQITTQQLRDARQLFARAIETPGGLKIQTIHSFCSGVLRRFPLEASVSPQFKEMDDLTGQALRAEVLDQMVEGTDAAVVHRVLTYFTGADLTELAQAVSGDFDRLSNRPADKDLKASIGLPENVSEQIIIDHVFQDGVVQALRAWLPILQAGSKTEAKAAEAISKVDLDRPSLACIEHLQSFAIYGETAKAPFGAKVDSFPTKATRAAHPELTEDLNHIMQAVADTRQDRLSLLTYARTNALYDFASVYLPAYSARKQALGLLDFDDLIRKTKELLTDRAVAQWVLFRLDGGIDHVLVDEAQDTSPDQWAVIRLLTQEFTAGEGARTDRERTIFVVGDQKQSIYSFQGAAPEAFDEMRHHFRSGLNSAGNRLEESVNLEHSFRSSSAILRTVDLTFPDPDMIGTADPSQHMAFKDDMPGRVDIWPVIEKAEQPEETPWFAPIDQPAETDEVVRLAEQVAAQIKHMIAHETLPVEDGHSGAYNHRPITAGDFLILVRGRVSGLFAEVIRACKSAELDIAGADRLRVGAELAVRDILALLNFLALPEDDLSLACALRSPLFGWSEQDLYSLAQPRPKGGYLWAALRQNDTTQTMAVIRDLRRQADFLRPYDLIERILTRHNGRRNLLARLGNEAEDGIDALLSQALNYENTGVPSLTGFLAWVAADDLVIKRQMDSQGDKIRVMTVHGAKGLEAPIVILPDCAKKAPKVRNAFYPADDHAVWPPSKPQRSDAVNDLHDALAEADAKESNRLLYVAMTRAEKWLIMAAAGEVGEGSDSWYSQVNAAMEHIGGEDATSFGLPVTRHQFGDWTSGDFTAIDTPTIVQPDPPAFGPLVTPKRVKTATPSGLKGAKVLPGDRDEDSDEMAMARGTAVHLLLEHLPLLDTDRWIDTGHALLNSLDEGFFDPSEIIAHAQRVLTAPHLTHLWGDHLREVDISAAINDLRFRGTIDLLIVDGNQVQAIDYKTNRIVPDRPEATPDGVLAQMAAYHTGLKQVFPDHTIEVAILWTQTAELMVLPQTLISSHRDRVTLP